MNHRILLSEQLAPDVFRLTIEAPELARRRAPRQDFVLGVNERGERIPLAIAEADPDKGNIVVIFQVAGPATEWLASLREGDDIPSLRVDQRRGGSGGGSKTAVLAAAVTLAMVLVGGVVAFLALAPKTDRSGPAVEASAPQYADRAGPGTLALRTRPRGALAFVDGELRCKATPCTIPDLAAGPHEIRLEKDGYAPGTRTVAVAGGGKATKLSLSLARQGGGAAPPPPSPAAARRRPAPRGPMGYLSIATIPPVTVQVDGETVALSPVLKHALTVGEHKVRLVDEAAWLDQSFPVKIEKGKVTQEHLRFGKGQLEIQGIPGIEIFIGSRRVGVTPIPPITLYTGTYIVRAKDETLGRDASFTATVVGDRKIVLPVDLRGSWGR